MGGPTTTTGPDLAAGIDAKALGDGASLLGHVGDEAVLLARRGDDVYAVSASCTHYGGPLVDGLVDGDTVRCPWHHACFDLKTGAALHAPALSPLSCFDVERRGERLVVLGKRAPAAAPTTTYALKSVALVGGGAASLACADMLRREGYAGAITMLSSEKAPPSDRPNLSKDYLAGNAPEEWIPVRPSSWFAEQKIDLRLDVRVASIDVGGKRVLLDGGAAVPYDALLLATGSEPIRLPIPGFDLPHVHTLRTHDDSKAIIAAAQNARRAVVLGASFIGLEVAASLRARGLAVDVVAPEARPLERILGAALGDLVRRIHEEHGVTFHLGASAASIDAQGVTTSTGEVLPADVVVAGVGVRPRTSLAEAAGLKTDKGVVVDAHLQTSAPGVYAAGDIARWPDPHSGQSIRVEHWVVAQRQGQIAAKNMLGKRTPCDLVPFFWSAHYDTTICYVGHALQWDRVDVDGDVAARDCTVRLMQGDRAAAVITIGRDRESLRAELSMEGRM